MGEDGDSRQTSVSFCSGEPPIVEKDTLRQILRQVKSFPGMPTTAAKLMPLLRDSASNIAPVEDLIKYDPGLTANLLKLTNSAYFGLPARISSVHQAILLLGRKRLLQLVTTMCMSGLMKKSVPGYDLPQGGLWRHSVAVAVAADRLVQSLNITQADEVFTAALLHDIGKMVLGDYVQEDLENIREMVAKGISFEVAEFVVLGTNHADIGARILNNWSMPEELVQAVAWHHDPDQCQNHCRLSDLVHVANIAVCGIGGGKSANDLFSEASSNVIARLGLGPSDIGALAEQTLQEMGKLTEILNG
jgi:putative nucleotidyltransferase with HDIG domain